MKFRLRRLSSSPASFDPIDLKDGVNLILGEKGPKKGAQSDKLNGVGKSVFVDFLHFALLRPAASTRVSKIPTGILPPELAVILDLEINGEALRITRALASPHQPRIENLSSGINRTFGKLDEATGYLEDLLFKDLPVMRQTSFRQLLGLLMRDEASAFRDFLNPMNTKVRAAPPLAPHLALMGIAADSVEKYQSVYTEIKELEATLRTLKKRLTQDGALKLTDIPASLNEEKEASRRIQKAISTLKTDPGFEAIEEELSTIEVELIELRASRKGLTFQIEQITHIPIAERIDTTDLTIVYEKIQRGLGDLVKKSLEQAQTFKAEIERFQQSLVQDDLTALKSEHATVRRRIQSLTARHHELTSRLDHQEVLDELKNGIEAATKQTEDYQHRRSLFDTYKAQEAEKGQMKSDLQTQLNEIRKEIEQENQSATDMEARIIELHQRIMKSAQASFRFEVGTKLSNKQPLTFDLRTKDDRSRSVDEAKVFIYDLALLDLANHPGFLLHDNILEVDNDTLIQSLNLLQELEETRPASFQYILTINRDKLDLQEIADQLNLVIPDHTRASFSKQTPFLKKQYQET